MPGLGQIAARWWWLPVGVGCVQLGVLCLRAARAPLDAYGDQGAEYIEHFERLRVALVVADDGPCLGRLAAVDGAYPPGLHLASVPWTWLTGGAAEQLWMVGWPWWLLLAAALAGVGGALEGRRGAVAGAVAGLATPAFGAAAGRYYYDLPMTALLWTAVAATLGGRAGLGGVLAGGAAVVKWTALPFAVPLALAAALEAEEGDATPRWRRVLLLGGLGLLGVAGGYLAISTASWSEMMFTFAPEQGGTLQRLGDAAGRIASAEPAGSQTGPVPTGLLGRLGFYGAGLVRAVFGPPLALLVGAGLALWGRGSRRGRWLLAACAAQLLLLVLLVPPLDERFLLTLAPGVAVVASLGLARRPVLGLLAVGLALGTSAEFHLGGGLGPWGLRSSWEQRGWARFDERRPARLPLREALWAVVGPHQPATVGVLGDAVVDPTGDEEWWRYRALLDEARGRRPEASPVEVLRVCAIPGARVDVVVGPDSRLLATEPWCPVVGDFGPPLRVADPEGGQGLLVWLPAVPVEPN